jgi:hypothetical protein
LTYANSKPKPPPAIIAIMISSVIVTSFRLFVSFILH